MCGRPPKEEKFHLPSDPTIRRGSGKFFTFAPFVAFPPHDCAPFLSFAFCSFSLLTAIIIRLFSYLRAMLMVHPDKLGALPLPQQVLGTRCISCVCVCVFVLCVRGRSFPTSLWNLINASAVLIAGQAVFQALTTKYQGMEEGIQKVDLFWFAALALSPLSTILACSIQLGQTAEG